MSASAPGAARLAWAAGATAGVVALGLALASTDPIRRRFPATRAVRAAGVLLAALGLLLRVWATWAFWVRGGGTPLPPLAPTRLVVAGPFRYSRNPLHLGWLGGWAGLGLLTGSPRLLWATAALWAVLQWVEIPWDERSLRRRFGADYDRYRREVPRWLRVGRARI